MDTEETEDGLAAREANLAERGGRAFRGPRDPDLLAELAKERTALADARDQAAEKREDAAIRRREKAADRDVAASERDRRSRVAHDDADPGFPNRFMSGRDVDASAGDRADALSDERAAREDRQHSREDRQRAADDAVAAGDAARDAADAATEEAVGLREALERRAVIGQAQGRLMAEHGITADEAFHMLVQQSQSSNIKLGDIAVRLVQRGANADS